ncbi:MAG: DUF4129 domain-containing protein, partial [Ardenticatenales bacterium]|nr:DUF4129 domain-containing protein [Ardenticatenales bacterium]
EYAERLGQQVPAVRPPLRRLAELFSKQRFSPQALAETEEGEAEQSWLEARKILVDRVVRRLTNRQEERNEKD